ncbi:MAG: glycoside hydrolase family 28 protein [Clostridia bacterium]|nr:glycoside hydrolase family 28 protein [Clostridia bacterium]
MEMNKIRKIVFDNEITLWWERVSLPKNGAFLVELNGKTHGKTIKTHYRFVGLSSETEYEIRVSIVDHEGTVCEELGKNLVKTTLTKKRLDVTKAPYFAVADGKTLNTLAFQKALDDCGKNEVVYFPAGVFLTGALNVHSDTEIYLEKDAVLQGTSNDKDYLPKRKSRFEGVERECYSSLLNIGELDHSAGCTTKNVVIRGDGTVDGGGADLSWAIIRTETARLKEAYENAHGGVEDYECEWTVAGRARGRLVNISNSQNVVLSGITLQNGPAWNIHMVYSKDVTTCHCKILSKGVWNGDGWDPDSSENCVIFDTDFDTHDDAIAVKSGKNPEGNIINRPTRNVFVFDCRGSNGIAIGSEMSGGIENVGIWDCDMSDSYGGFTVRMPKERGGYIRNVHISDCKLATLHVLTKINFNNDGKCAETTSVLEDFFAENVEIVGISLEKGMRNVVAPIVMSGLSESAPIRNVALKNVRLFKHKNGELPELKIENVENFVLENIHYTG